LSSYHQTNSCQHLNHDLSDGSRTRVHHRHAFTLP
jgi:hypothetical protein